jgi:hypothetical protein
MRNRRPRKARLWVEELEGRVVPAILGFSTNWSGYAVAAMPHTVTYVQSSWILPAATAAGYSASWVGIDGYTSSTVEQIGTESDFLSGKGQYYAWYEMYPMPTVKIDQPVHPGDQITASVLYTPGVGFTLSINDNAWSTPFTKTVSSNAAQRSSAEVVVEAPSTSKVLPLANTGTQTFTGSSITVSGQATSLTAGQPQTKVEQIDMTTSRGVLKDTTSPLTSNGSSFSVTFLNSGTTAQGTHLSTGGRSSHDTNTQVLVVTISAPSVAAFAQSAIPTLVAGQQLTSVPPRPLALPVAAPAGFSFPVVISQFGNSASADFRVAGDDGGGDRGVQPAGPATPAPTQPGVPAAPQSQLDVPTAPPVAGMTALDNEEAPPVLHDDVAPSIDLSDGGTKTAEFAAIVLTLSLSGTSGLSVSDPTARRKPGDAEADERATALNLR